jgi:hypothetical protein
MREDAQRAQAHHEKYREIEQFVESAIGLAVDEAQRIVMEGVEAAVGPPRLIKTAQDETIGKRTFHVRATSPTSHVEVEVSVDVTGINKLADDTTKLEHLLDVSGMVTVPRRRKRTLRGRLRSVEHGAPAVFESGDPPAHRDGAP